LSSAMTYKLVAVGHSDDVTEGRKRGWVADWLSGINHEFVYDWSDYCDQQSCHKGL
jgi:hypothetical protein